jgi:hypothetical protein
MRVFGPGTRDALRRGRPLDMYVTYDDEDNVTAWVGCSSSRDRPHAPRATRAGSFVPARSRRRFLSCAAISASTVRNQGGCGEGREGLSEGGRSANGSAGVRVETCRAARRSGATRFSAHHVADRPGSSPARFFSQEPHLSSLLREVAGPTPPAEAPEPLGRRSPRHRYEPNSDKSSGDASRDRARLGGISALFWSQALRVRRTHQGRKSPGSARHRA